MRIGPRLSPRAFHQFTAAAEGIMTPPLYIALRFLTHRKRALLLSLSGVVFGVAIFICTQAQTQGFAQHFIDSTIGRMARSLSSRVSVRATSLSWSLRRPQ